VKPILGGEPQARITYRSVEPGKAVITGAELLTNWSHVDESMWTARVSNRLFGSYNPYTTPVSGDWLIPSAGTHTGEVYLNGKSMYEAAEKEEVLHPVKSEASWEPEFSVYTWYTEQDEATDETVFYANFQEKNPNEECVELSVRRSCFCPQEEGRDYITLSGFVITQAATQWAPPTAFQEGMINVHWSRGWIIEDCEISESKCSGISLGKYHQPENDNKWLHWKYKDGTQTQRECVCQAEREGWTKERIGHHIVRRCHIHDCGQTGIVGHMGAAFSLIEENQIHHINHKKNLVGAEIGGIKIHAAIDVIFRKNHIHHCSRGIWLDWQAQGTRVTQNLFHHNTLPNLKEGIMPPLQILQGAGEDLFIEVSHGPTLVDHNIFLSERALKLATQGVALVHNLIAGSLAAVGRGTDNGSKSLPSPRYTPYHVPHRTELAGFMTILHGDMRFYNNIFVQQKIHPGLKELERLTEETYNEWDDFCIETGTFRYDAYPTFEEWNREFEGYCGIGSEVSDRYYMHLPVWMAGNAYFNGARPWKKEQEACENTTDEIHLELKEQDGTRILSTNLYQVLPACSCKRLGTEDLGMAFEPEQKFENPDGTPIEFQEDYLGRSRKLCPVAGPFEAAEGENAFVVIP
jgi:hypothetical protein